MYWFFLLIATVTAVFGQGLMKAGAGAETFVRQLLSLPTIAGVGCYGLSALSYMAALRGIPLSVALPVTALSYVFVAMIGHFVFGEALGPQRLGGLAMIMAGVLVLGFS